MKRLEYTTEELKMLRGYIQPYVVDSYLHDKKTPIGSMRRLYDTITPCPVCTNPYDHRWVYEAVKANVCESVTELMYHTPIKKLPLLINHKDPVLRTLVLWRLSIGR